MTLTSHGRVAVAVTALITVLVAITGCGGGGGSSTTTTDPSSTTTTSASSVDALAFRDCILSGSIKVGIYDSIDAGPEATKLAGQFGATFFEANKADNGFAFFYVLDDPANAGDLQTSLANTLTDYQVNLQKSAPAGITLGDASVESDGAIVVGFIPISAGKAEELSKGVMTDVSTCLQEAG